MIKYINILWLFMILFFLGCKNNTTEPSSQDKAGWNLVWSDEFNYTGLPDSTKWDYDVGGDGWGNNELQYYTFKRDSNARVENGNLIIEARREIAGSNYFTSARLLSTNTGNWTYGRFEVRAKIPKGRGTWPAIWMLPTNWTYGNGGWPDNGEIDIMEHVGYDPGVIHGSTHTNKYNWKINTGKTATIKIPDAQEEFHVYALEWYADSLSIFVDSTKYFTFKNEHTGWQVWPFDKNFHFILNLAIGGSWGGQQGIDMTAYPTQMLIDYVRVYKWKE